MQRSPSSLWRYVPAALAFGSPVLAMAIFFGIGAAIQRLAPQAYAAPIVGTVAIGNSALAAVASGIGGWLHVRPYDRPFGRFGNTFGGILYGFFGYVALFTFWVASAD